MAKKLLACIYILVYLKYACHVHGKKPPPAAYSKELETELRTSIFNGYEIFQRPRKRVAVRMSLNMLSVNYLDIKEQTLAITAYFTIEWKDGRLEWSGNSTFTNIKFLFSNELNMWKPALVIENSVDNIDVISKPNVPMRVTSDGIVIWTPGGVFITHCESDVTYWPLDTQTCHIKLSTWAYTSNEVFLSFRQDVFIMDYFQENGEWEIISRKSSSSTSNRETQSFSRLKFTLVFRRRPLFHLLNTLFPVVLMGFLTIIVFKLPPESGERVGLALTILLAYAVYLTLISENIPQTSLSASILSAYLASILLLQSLSVLLTVIYLDIYFTPKEKPVPAWLKVVSSKILARLVCVQCRTDTTAVAPTSVSSYPDNEDDCAPNSSRAVSKTDVFVQEFNPTNEIADRKCGTNDRKSVNSLNGDDVDEAWSENRDGHNIKHEYTWKEIALLLDKITMYVYMLLIVGVTAYCMGIIWQKHTSD